ncbi:MAG: hypothetical protein N3F08_01065 [Crenarchaeota archaeon]|nr:hypothetical protein [Thermoproteota archaeon]
MTVRRKAVYDTRFFATLYDSKNPDEKEGKLAHVKAPMVIGITRGCFSAGI